MPIISGHINPSRAREFYVGNAALIGAIRNRHDHNSPLSRQHLEACWICQPDASFPKTGCAVALSKEEFKLITDPAEVIALNNTFRRPDVAEGADLWSLDQVMRAAPRQWPYPATTFAPSIWPQARLSTQEAYSEVFAKRFPIVAELLPIENVVVAGGAAVWPLCERSTDVGDIDLFIYGLDAEARWKKLDELVCRIFRVLAAQADPGEPTNIVIQKMQPGSLSLRVLPRGAQYETSDLVISIILRNYESVSAILHAGDIPSACVAYDGRVAYLTSLGAHANIFRVNVVHPEYGRSRKNSDYEERLAKYFGRGFALVFPYLDAAAFRRDKTLELRTLRLKTKFVRGAFITGSVEPMAAPVAAEESTLDTVCLNNPFESLLTSAISANLLRIARGTPKPVVAAAADVSWLHFHRKTLTDRCPPGMTILDFGEAAQAKLATYGEGVLNAATFMSALDELVEDVVDTRTGRLALRTLREVLGLTDAELLKFIDAVRDCSIRERSYAIDVKKALAPFVARLHAKYRAVEKAPVHWWLTPSAFVADYAMNARDWYADYYAASPPKPAPADQLATLLATLEMRCVAAPGRDAECAICHDVLTPGARNAIVLGCGHLFHWSGAGCGGLSQWMETSRERSCPMCRKIFYGEERSGPSRAQIELSVDW